MDVGGVPISLKYVNFVLFCQIRTSSSIHIFRGSSYIHGSKNLCYIFISFVSSNCVVINHQKGRDCKCNQALMWVLVIMTTQLGTNKIYRDDKQVKLKGG